MTKIIIAEDDADLRESFQECLHLQGFDVTGAGSALEFFQAISTQDFDVAIIDAGLPDQSGFEIVKVLTRRPTMGVIMVTARGETEDRIRGFNSGSDLYFVKPVDCRELAAAITSLVRRLKGGAGPAADVPVSPPLAGRAAGMWRFDRGNWTLGLSDGPSVNLTSAEVRLMETLLDQPGTTVSRQDLLSAQQYEDDEAGHRNLEAVIRRLRRKIEGATGGRAPIQTVHNRGYMFSAPVQIVGRAD